MERIQRMSQKEIVFSDDFSNGLNSPELVKLPVNCLKSIEN